MQQEASFTNTEGAQQPTKKPYLTKKLQKLKYNFEEVLRDEDQMSSRGSTQAIGQRFKGYLDDAYQSTDGAGGPTSNYAIMIYNEKDRTFQLVPVDKHFKFEKEIKASKAGLARTQ